MARADKITLTRKKTDLYSDFLTNFDQNPLTGNLARVTNEASVKQSLKNLMLTNTGERFYYSNKGSKIRGSLFENFDPFNIEIIKIQANEAISAFEPRAQIHDIRLKESLETNSYQITFVFSVLNIIDQDELTINVTRVR